jgi:hypothetical protein
VATRHRWNCWIDTGCSTQLRANQRTRCCSRVHACGEAVVGNNNDNNNSVETMLLTHYASAWSFVKPSCGLNNQFFWSYSLPPSIMWNV